MAVSLYFRKLHLRAESMLKQNPHSLTFLVITKRLDIVRKAYWEKCLLQWNFCLKKSIILKKLRVRGYFWHKYWNLKPFRLINYLYTQDIILGNSVKQRKG